MDAGVAHGPRLVLLERFPPVDVPAAPSNEGIPLPILLRPPRIRRHALQEATVLSIAHKRPAVAA